MILLADWLVVPGVRLGGVAVGARSATLSPLGRPTVGDAAMGKYWSTWVGKGGGRLDVYATRKGTEQDVVTVDLVRATSPRFRLANGLHASLPAARFRARYPRAHEVKPRFWDDVRTGLAWEVRGRSVASVIVHRRGLALPESLGVYTTSPLQRG